MQALKIVADTNLWIAARFNLRSFSAEILNLAGEGRVKLLWSADTRKELERVLSNVKATPEFMLGVERLLSISIDVGPTEKLQVVEADPDDDKILACAQAGQADYIVTNDEHLLSLGRFGRTEIVTPKAFLQHLGRRRTF